MPQPDVIIIGAGIIGASVALGLSRRGFKTLNLDALPAAGYGSTSNSSAIIRPFYSAVESCALAHESRYHWTVWPDFLDTDDESGFAKYTECGMLILASNGDGALFPLQTSAMDEVGVTYERLNYDQIGERFPVLSLNAYGPPKQIDDPGFGAVTGSDLSGGIFMPEAGYMSDPQLATHNLQRAAEARGAKFRFNARIDAIPRKGGRVAGVRLESGEVIDAPIVINVAGPHSAIVNAMAGLDDEIKMPTRPMRNEVAHIPAPDGFEPSRGGCVVGDGDVGVYFRPEIGGNILIGSLDPEGDEREFVDPDDYNTSLSEQWTRQVWRTAQRIPALGIPNTARGVVGLYDVTPDWTPIYDRSSLGGYYMAIGTSGNQFKNAPIIGQLMATLVSAVEAGHDHDKDPLEFYLEHLERPISLGFYSRLRRSHGEGGGTVLA
jgi:glycine/D-amino acid oxidase-like deaminating enzyme